MNFSKIFSSLEFILCDPKCSKRIKEHSALCIVGLIRFNKDVFVGKVLMGPQILYLCDFVIVGVGVMEG